MDRIEEYAIPDSPSLPLKDSNALSHQAAALSNENLNIEIKLQDTEVRESTTPTPNSNHTQEDSDEEPNNYKQIRGSHNKRVPGTIKSLIGR